MTQMTPNQLARFEKHYVFTFPGDCWLWISKRDKDGYPIFYFGRHAVRAHRLSYEHFVGPIPGGLTIDHLCRTRACVRPEHLEPVTQAENTRRGGPATKTKCVNGHPYDAANTYLRPASGSRDCRACMRERQRRSWAKKRAAA